MNYKEIIEGQMKVINKGLKKVIREEKKKKIDEEWRKFQREFGTKPVGYFPHERDSSWSGY